PELGTEITQRTRGEKGVAGGVRGDVAVGVAADPGLPRPFQTSEEKSTARHERADVGTDAHPRHLQHECSCSSWLMSVREDFVEKSLGLVLIRLFREGEFTHQDLPRLGEHPLLARGKTAFLIAPPKVTDDLGDLVHVAGGELFDVRLVPPRPVRGLLGVRGAQHLEDPLQPVLAHHVADADVFGVRGGHAYRKITLVDPEDEVRPFLALNGSSFDRLDTSSPVMGIDNGVADLESHVTSTPSATTRVPRICDLTYLFGLRTRRSAPDSRS